MKLTKPQQRRFIEYWLPNHDGVSEHDATLFERLENRVNPVLEEKNIFEKQNLFRDYFEGNFMKNSSVFAMYLLMKYRKQGRHSVQKRLSTILAEMGMEFAIYGSLKWNEAVPLCIGLFARFQDVFTGSFTNDLEIVNINI